MFTSILDVSTGTLSLASVLACIGAALLLGLVVALVYRLCGEHYSKGFLVTLALLPVLVQTIIIMTSGSLGSAVAVVGAFSLVRFRSAPGTSKEIFSIFFSMAIGLACGMGQIAFAVLITLIVSAVFLLLMKSPFGETHTAEKHLKVTIPEDLDYTEIFDDIFKKYVKKAELMKVKTVNLGSMYELDYDIVLEDSRREKQMIDEIRVRNGNLSIVCGRRAEAMTEL